MRVRDLNDLEQWLLFFLTGIIETSKKSIETFDKILTLKQEIEAKIMQGGKQVEKLSIIMEYLYSRPILNAKTIQEITQVTTPTVYSLIRTLQEIGVLQEMTGQKRNRLFQFSEYLNLFRHKS